MRLETTPNFVELLITEVASSRLPSAGDIRVDVKTQIESFVGSGSCWIEEATLRAFSAATKQLLSSFQGSARLESISAGEFSLSLSPANSRGYVLVQVAISKSTPFPRAISGEFECELSALAHIVSWSEAARQHA